MKIVSNQTRWIRANEKMLNISKRETELRDVVDNKRIFLFFYNCYQ